MNRFTAQLVAVAVMIGGLTACSTTDKPNMALETARQTYTRVSSDANVARYAALQLKEAEQALRLSEALWRDDADEEEVTHTAYLATQHAKIAEQTARTELARQSVKEAEAERARLRAELSSEQARLAEERAQRLEEEKLAAEQRAQQAQSDAEAARTEVGDLQRQLEEASKKGVVLTLGSDILFDVNQATLKAGARPSIEKVATFLKENPDRKVTIIGHTDNTGDEAYNQRLSERRADSVREMLMEFGITSQQATSEGRGESSPIASNDTAAGRQLNRRVELVISDPES